MANIAVTYTFSNSTTADATQVNQNYTDIINGLSDGTKDISVNAGTFAGNVSISGNTTIGNASGDDLTVTASLASHIGIKTTNTYDLGTSSVGLRALYFGANSQTVNLKGSASMSATWTFTLPISAGTSGQVMHTDGSGVSSWRYVEKTTAKTTTYTGTGDETTILCDASGGGFTVTLPAAASFTGKHYHIKKTDSSVNVVTIDGNSSETIDGALTKKLATRYESIKLVSDGSNWHVVGRVIPQTSASITLTYSAGFGTVTNTNVFARRVGDSLHIYGYFLSGTVAASAMSITLPSGYAIDTAKIGNGSNNGVLGIYQQQSGGATSAIMSANFAGYVFYDGSDTDTFFFGYQMGTGNLVKNNGTGSITDNQYIGINITVPIANWEG